jgi:transcription elongation GreA/GreB family factor
MNEPNPQMVDAAAVLPHLQEQIGNLSLQLAAAKALGEQRQQLALGQAKRIAEQDARIAELEEQLRAATPEGTDDPTDPDCP